MRTMHLNVENKKSQACKRVRCWRTWYLSVSGWRACGLQSVVDTRTSGGVTSHSRLCTPLPLSFGNSLMLCFVRPTMFIPVFIDVPSLRAPFDDGLQYTVRFVVVPVSRDVNIVSATVSPVCDDETDDDAESDTIFVGGIA